MYLLTYLLTQWSTVLLGKLTGSAASQEIIRIFGIRKFITVLTSACHLYLSQPTPSSPQNPSHFLKIHFNIILPSGSGSPHWSFSLRFPHQNPAHLSPLPLHASCPAHLIPLHFTTRRIINSTETNSQTFESFFSQDYLSERASVFCYKHIIISQNYAPQCYITLRAAVLCYKYITCLF